MRVTIGDETDLERVIVRNGVIPALAGLISVIKDRHRRGLQIPLSVRDVNPTLYADDSDVAHIVAELQRLAVDVGRD